MFHVGIIIGSKSFMFVHQFVHPTERREIRKKKQTN